ncbi:MAG TPA: hypothetical protein VMD59_19905 [Acidimicrobiales bacterium]|nr:hypothetical protein [Acidimicrobiales bacterium]
MSDVVEAGARRFLAAEAATTRRPGRERDSEGVSLAGIGTTAPTAVRGSLLAEAIAACGSSIASATAYADPEELLGGDWELGLVLSPFKRDVAVHCDVLSPSATEAGVVDTLLRTEGAIVGYNTNTWAAQSALEVLCPGAAPSRVLLLGAGASARSVGLALRRAWPGSDLSIAARSEGAASELVTLVGGRVHGSPPGERRSGATEPFDVAINATTWGETESSESEPSPFDVSAALRPGGRFFDLNNRISALQLDALRAGCAVVSGSLMQRVTNACRAALVRPAG